MTVQNNAGGNNIPSFSQLKDKITSFKPTKTQWYIIIGASVIMIVERKMNLKPKKMNFDWGGKK